MNERRLHNRVRVEMKAAYRDDEFMTRMGRVINLSLGGMFLETGGDVPLDGFVTASIDDGGFGKVIHVRGQVVRKVDSGVGIVFTRVDARGIRNILTYLGVSA
jgi:hypothetical protein